MKPWRTYQAYFILYVLSLVWWSPNLYGANAPLQVTRMGMTSWAQRRDIGVVKQQFDYSCGASALATLMSLYGRQTAEKEVLGKLLKDKESSFQNLAEAAQSFGFRAKGLAVGLAQLKKLKLPVILYFHHKRNDHFTVFTGWDQGRFQVADPTWGNLVLDESTFKEKWFTRDDESFVGRILVLIPNPGQQVSAPVTTLPSPRLALRAFLRSRP